MQELPEQDAALVNGFSKLWALDLHGEHLGIDVTDDSGRTTYSPDIFTVDETGVTEYSVLGRRRIRWQDTREIGLLIRRGKHGWSIHQKNWRENAAIYLSSRPLMDAERVGLRSPHRVHIEFPYCSDLRPANDRDRRIHAAMVQFAPAELPLPFHERLELLHPVYVVLAENADGALSETPGEIPDPAEVYYRLLNED